MLTNYSEVTCKTSLELGSFQVIWQTCVTDTWCRKAALYMFHLCTHAELGMIYACKLNPPSPLTPGVAVLPRRKGNISQAEHVFTALRHSWRRGGGEGMLLKSFCHQLFPRDRIRLHGWSSCSTANTQGNFHLSMDWGQDRHCSTGASPVSASYSKHRNQTLKKENERSP